MARRGGGQATVLVADDWSTLWRCACGYDNAGRERCLVCGVKAPDEAQGTPGLHAEEEVLPRAAPRLDQQAGRKALRTVFRTIGLNVVLLGGVVPALLLANDVDRASFIKIQMYAGIAYFVIIALWVLSKAAVLGVQPVLGRAKALVGMAEGFVVGGITAVLLVGGMRLAVGRPLLDPATTSIAAEGSIVGMVIGIVAIAVMAPVVEELVFRGFLAETFLQRWGKTAAVLVSAAAFSLAHLRLMQFWYFGLMGIGLGLVYFRRGLVGSIAAHATFNGLLVVLAVAAMHADPVVVEAGGSTLAVPPTYQVVEEGLEPYEDVRLIGPLGAQVAILHLDDPAVPPVEVVAQAFLTGAIPLPEGVQIDAVVVNMLDLPVGRVVSLIADFDGMQGRFVALPTEGRLWMAVYQSDGSSRSSFEFDDMLRSWRLPGQLM